MFDLFLAFLNETVALLQMIKVLSKMNGKLISDKQKHILL